MLVTLLSSLSCRHRRFVAREYNAQERRAGSRAAPQESSGRVSTFRFYSLVGRSAAPLRVKFVALRCARRVRGALSRTHHALHHRAFDCASHTPHHVVVGFLSVLPVLVLARLLYASHQGERERLRIKDRSRLSSSRPTRRKKLLNLKKKLRKDQQDSRPEETLSI